MSGPRALDCAAVPTLTDVLPALPEALRHGDLLTDDEFLDAQRPLCPGCGELHVGFSPKIDRDLPYGAARVLVIAVLCGRCGKVDPKTGEPVD